MVTILVGFRKDIIAYICLLALIQTETKQDKGGVSGTLLNISKAPECILLGLFNANKHTTCISR